jgi:hypothetical protein
MLYEYGSLLLSQFIKFYEVVSSHSSDWGLLGFGMQYHEVLYTVTSASREPTSSIFSVVS